MKALARAARACARACALLLVVLLLIVPAAAARAELELTRSARARRALARVQSAWARGSLWALGARLECRDHSHGALARARREGALLIANHLGYLDVLALSALVPCRFLAKHEIADWGIAGWLARLVDTLFVDRAQRRELLRLVPELRATLEAGVSAALFPEGRTSAGMEVAPFHAGLLEAAVQSGKPCLPLVLRYELDAGEGAPGTLLCWWDATSFAAHLARLLGLRGMRIEVEVLAAARAGLDRKLLARELHTAIAERFRPVRQEQAADAPRQPHAEAEQGTREA